MEVAQGARKDVDSTIAEGARKDVDVPPGSQQMERIQGAGKDVRIVDVVDSGEEARNLI